MSPPARDVCDQVLDALATGDPLPRALDEHARGCARCRPLTRIGALLDMPAGPPLEMSPALREALQDARPVTPRSSLARAAPTLLVCAGAVLAQRFVGPSASLASPRSAMLLAFAGLGLGLVFWRGADGVGSPARWRRTYPVLAAALAALTASVGATGAPFGASSSRPWSPGTAMDGVLRAPGTGADDVTATLATAVVVTTIAATTALLGARRTTPNLPALSGATAGAAAALVGVALAHHGALPGGGVAVLAHVALVVGASVLASIVGRASLAP